ncbi:MAG: SPW repeat protein [Minisyncoccia bacterium]
MAHWIEGIVGFWILLSPWLLGFANISIAKWSSILCGLILILVNSWLLFGGQRSNKGPSQTNP